MEQNFKTFRRDIMKAEKKESQGIVLSYEEALEEIREYLQEKIGDNLEFEKRYGERKKVIRDKNFLRQKKQQYREYITECIGVKNIKVRNYQGEKINDFIEEMVAEFAGYSILEDAFKDPTISDIYIIDWETIIVEKDGKNMLYPHKFKSPSHFLNVLERFLNEADKEINLGDSKIVNFELYGDRCCATSPGVTPKGYTLTIRKHTGTHITRDQLVSDNIMDKKLADLLGLLILGETNMICAGRTGSGKTTTLRALLDYYVTKANKRMIVCEDTQELFPKNKHTIEFVSVESEDPQIAVTLQELIFTSLRLKPKYIVVGEVRGMEAEAAVEAMETGHSTFFTMHGGTPWNIVNRLVTKYLMAMPNLGIDIVERIVGSAVDYIFIQDDIPGIGRRITSLTEVSYDFEKRRVAMKPICEFDFVKKTWVWKNKLGDEKISKMFRSGVPLEDLKPWMGEK